MSLSSILLYLSSLIFPGDVVDTSASQQHFSVLTKEALNVPNSQQQLSYLSNETLNTNASSPNTYALSEPSNSSNKLGNTSWHLLTYADSGTYAETARKMNASFSKAGFATFKQWTGEEFMNSTLYSNNAHLFKILDSVGKAKYRKAMYWLWKPLIILDHLNTVNENDWVLYSDASSYHPYPIDPAFSTAMPLLEQLALQNHGSHCDCIPGTRLPLSIAWEYHHARDSSDLYSAMKLLGAPVDDCTTLHAWANASMTQASWSLWRSNTHTKAVVRTWIDAMFQPNILDVVPYADQSVMGLLVVKLNLKTFWWPHPAYRQMDSSFFSKHGNVVKSILTAAAVEAVKMIAVMEYANVSTSYDVRPTLTLPCTKENIPTSHSAAAVHGSAGSRTAVCLLGFPGATQAAEAFQRQVVDVLKADVFIVSSKNASAFHPLATSDEPVRLKQFFDIYAPKWVESKIGNNYLSGLPGFYNGSGAAQVASRWFCSQLIKKNEYTMGRRYAFVGIGRLDLMWLAPHPVTHAHGCWIPFKQNDWGGYCDHWAFCSRDAAEAAMEGPLSILPLHEVTNTESHLKKALQHFHVSVHRGQASFIRSCPDNSNSTKCVFSPKLGISGKPSGGQMDYFL